MSGVSRVLDEVWISLKFGLGYGIILIGGLPVGFGGAEDFVGAGDGWIVDARPAFEVEPAMAPFAEEFDATFLFDGGHALCL